MYIEYLVMCIKRTELDPNIIELSLSTTSFNAVNAESRVSEEKLSARKNCCLNTDFNSDV